jgi:hypothetical protein
MVTKVTSETVRKQEKRRPFGVPVSRLSVSQEIEGYHLRWINDEPGRIALAQESGYSFVEPHEVGRTGEDKVKELSGVQRDERTPMYMYLMKIPMEFYLEDRNVLKSQQDNIDDAIRGGKLVSGENRYVPEGGISYKTK